MKRFLVVLVGTVGLVPAMLPAAAPVSGKTPLVAFDRFFVPSVVQAPLLSPDGRWVSYIGRYQDAYNIFVAPIGNIAAARPITHEKGRGIQWHSVSGAVTYRWTADSRSILYQLDNNGDEKYRLFAVDPVTTKVRALTPGTSIRAQLLAISRTRPDHILAAIDTALTERNPSLITGSDIVDIDLFSGEQRVVMRKIPYQGIIADNNLKPRLAWSVTKELGVDIVKLDENGAPSPFYNVGPDDVGGISATGETDTGRVSADNRTFYMLDGTGRDTLALTAFDLSTGKKSVVAADDRVDVRDILYDPKSNAVQAAGINWTMLKWHAIDPTIAADLAFLQRREGELHVDSRAADGRTWIVHYTRADQPDVYYHYDSRNRSLTKLFVAQPGLVGLPLVKMFPYEIKARDGLTMVGYYALPLSSDPNQTGKPIKPAPMIVYVHGGPTDERPQYAYSSLVQYFANRGYGLLYVNFRGGAGFGKRFLNAGNMEWGGKMHDDVIDQVKWAIAHRLADPKRIAVLGGSYGGYETLVAMTRSPEMFACGISLVGPSDLSIPMPHWSPEWMARVMGDPRTPEGQKMLRSRSPYYLANRVTRPILIGQGDQDSRVPTAQSDRMVQAMQAVGAPVVYLRFPDEGHGLLRPENNRAFWATSEIFLSKCLGGRSTPLDQKQFAGSSVIVAAGADYIPGLAASVAAAAKSKP